MICPRCDSQGQTYGIACGPTGGRIGYFKCNVCQGTGEITEEHLERIEQGKLLREDRVNRRRVTMREEAARLGCGFAEWSRIEGGYEPETDAGRAALAKRLTELSTQ